MSAAYVGAAAAVGSVVQGIGSSHDAERAAERSADFAEVQYMQQMDNYWKSKEYFNRQEQQATRDFDTAVGHAQTSQGLAGQQSQAYNQYAQDMMGGMDTALSKEGTANASKVDFSGFLSSFQAAMVNNEEALETFNRRYGSIMDNVVEGINNVSQARLSSGGREQLSLDMETMGDQFKSQMAASGMGRSGMAVDMEQRMAMEALQQGRAIDIAAYEQAGTLQAMGINSLNSMENMRQGIYQRGENIQQNQGQGMLQGATTDASNRTSASISTAGNLTQANISNANNANALDRDRMNIAANMFGRGFQGELQASNNLGNMYLSQANTAQGAQNNFMNAQAFPSSANVSNAYQNQSNQSNADAAGYMQTAGSLAGSKPVTNWLDTFNSPGSSLGQGTLDTLGDF